MMTPTEAALGLREWFEVFRRRGKGNEPTVKEFLEAADLIEKLDKRVTRWISVEERLPEVEKRVLLLTDKGVTCGFHEDGKMWQDDSKVNWDYDMDLEYDEEQDAYRIPEGWVEENLEAHDEWHCVVLSYKVTHWMPLPEPPKEEGP